MRSRRGGALLMCLALVAATTTVIVAQCDLTATGLRFESQAERRRAADYAFEALLAQTASDRRADRLSLPATIHQTIGTVACDGTITDHTATLARSLQIDCTLTVKGSTFTRTAVVGDRQAPSVFFYAIAAAAAVSSDQTLSTGSAGADGDAYFGGDVALTGPGSAIGGDLEAVGAIASAPPVTGVALPHATPVSFPTARNSDYESAADSVVAGPSLDGYAFPTGGAYPLIYCAGDLNIQGTFGGRGTIYVAGNVTVSGDMAYTDSYSEVAIIAGGTISFAPGTTQAVGIFYAAGAVQTSSPLAITRGTLAGAGISWAGTLAVAGDPDVWRNRDEGGKLKLPGMWP